MASNETVALLTRDIMTHDRANEGSPNYRPLGQALRRLGPGRNGRPTHLATGIRWATDGVRLSDGTILHLGAKRLPGRWVITDEALDEFVDRLTADRAGQGVPTSARTPAAQTRSADRASRECARLGL